MARIADLIEQYLREHPNATARESAEALEKLIQGSFVVLPEKLGGKRDA